MTIAIFIGLKCKQSWTNSDFFEFNRSRSKTVKNINEKLKIQEASLEPRPKKIDEGVLQDLKNDMKKSLKILENTFQDFLAKPELTK